MKIDRGNVKTFSAVVVPIFALLLILWNAVGKFYFFSYYAPASSFPAMFDHIVTDFESFIKAVVVEIVFVVMQLTAQLPEYQSKRFAKPLYIGSLFASVALTYPAMYVIYTSWFNLAQLPPLIAATIVLILVLSVDAYAELAILNV